MRRLDGQLQGNHRSLWRGGGLDLADLREYQHHDDVRHIDWNVTARLQTPYVRQFTEDRELAAWFLVDLSGECRLRLRQDDQAARGARVRRRAGAAAHPPRQPRGRHPATTDNAVDRPCCRRVAAALQVLHLLQRMVADRCPARRISQRSHRPARSPCWPARVSSSGAAACSWCPTSSAPPAGTWSWARLAQRHEVTAVRLFDPLEMDLPDLGLVTMT